jgi:hypothetical protein
MEKLKVAMENLLIDEEIVSRISEYNDLMDKLNKDEQISKMHTVIRISYSDSWRSCTWWLSCL